MIVPLISQVVLIRSIQKFSKERLNQKQKIIIRYIVQHPQKVNVTKLVTQLVGEIDCCSSTVWNNLNSLKRAGRINYGSAENRGHKVILTRVGKLLEVTGW